jgi:hypothetical protein
MKKRYRVRYPNGTRVKKNCVICGKEMILITSLLDTKKTCSRECRSKLQSIYASRSDCPLKKGTKMVKIDGKDVYFKFNNRDDKVGIVDLEDWDKIKKYAWRILNNHQSRGYEGNLYGTTVLWDTKPKKVVLLHRFILGIHLEDGKTSKRQVDHINGNGLDNRKDNLRVITQSQNNHNKHRGQKGKYQNIRWNSSTGKFVAQMKIETKKIYLGKDYNTPDEALEAYNKARQEFLLTGTLAILNK